MYLYLLPILIAFITAVLGPSFVEYIKSKLSNKKKDTIQEAIKVNELINKQIEITMNELGCDGIWLAQFHNGGHFYPTGKSIQKFSIFYEKTLPGTDGQSVYHTYQNVPCSLFSNSLAKLYKDKELLINESDKDDNYYDLNTFTKKFNSKSLYLITLTDIDDHFIGILILSYNKVEYNLDDTEWTFLRHKIGILGTMLTSYLNKTK